MKPEKRAMQSETFGRSEDRTLPIQSEGGASVHSERTDGDRCTHSSQLAANGRNTSAPGNEEADSHPTYTRQLLDAGYERQVPGRGALRHDTEGWGCLESSFHTLQVGFTSAVLHALHTN